LKAAHGVLVKVEGGLGPVALDGKRLRGSQHGTSSGIHMLAVPSPRGCKLPLAVPPDSGEMIQALELIKTLPAE
jgi:hypothetical protein